MDIKRRDRAQLRGHGVAKDGKKDGCFHIVGGMAELAKAPAIITGEGYATAASLKQSLGFATV